MLRHPHRVWPLQGASNFRDLGGYPAAGGRTLRWRRLFRSDHLAGLTEADQRTLAALELDRAIDFRGVDERADTPYALPGAGQHALPIEPTVVQGLQALREAGRRPDAETTAELMRELYRHLVNDQAHRFAEFFAHLLDARGPVVFHCTAGKDRTGVAAALVMLALGVPQPWVSADYLLTNEVYRVPPPPADDALAAEMAEARAVLWRVQADFLQAALDAIDRDQGGLEPYFERRLGLTPAARRALCERYLAD